MNITIVPLIRETGAQWGVSWGPRRILVDEPDTARLMWVGGRTVYVNRMSGTKYFPGELVIARNMDGLGGKRWRTLLEEGGRLTRDMLLRQVVQAAIVERWGHEVAERVGTTHTVRVAR